jgi:hypothetical protein
MDIPAQMLLSFLPAPVPPQVTGQLQNAYAMVAQAIKSKADRVTIAALSLTVSDPPTQAEVAAIVAKVNELVEALKPR